MKPDTPWQAKAPAPHRCTNVCGAGAFACLTLFALSLHAATEADLRKALASKTGRVTLPEGTYEISREIALPPDAHDLEIVGPGVTIKAAASFRGRALVVIPHGSNIKVF